MKVNHLFFPFLFSFLFSCKTAYQPASQVAQLYSIADSSKTDSTSALAVFLKPYRDSLSSIMNEIVGYAQNDLVKERPSGSLGNLVVKAMDSRARKMNAKLLGAICNYGGLRLSQIPKGPILQGKIYELLPFENELVILEIKGELLKIWLDHIASSGGWPLLLRETYENGFMKDKALHFKGKELVHGLADTSYQELKDGSFAMYISQNDFKDDSIYYVATNDYVANGGENCDFLKPLQRSNTGILIRSLLLEYIRKEVSIQADSSKSILLED